MKIVQVGEALSRRPDPSKERFRRLHNAKHCECQAYESEKIKRNQELVSALQVIFKTHGEKP